MDKDEGGTGDSAFFTLSNIPPGQQTSETLIEFASHVSSLMQDH